MRKSPLNVSVPRHVTAMFLLRPFRTAYAGNVPTAPKTPEFFRHTPHRHHVPVTLQPRCFHLLLMRQRLGPVVPQPPELCCLPLVAATSLLYRAAIALSPLVIAVLLSLLPLPVTQIRYCCAVIVPSLVPHPCSELQV